MWSLPARNSHFIHGLLYCIRFSTCDLSLIMNLCVLWILFNQKSEMTGAGSSVASGEWSPSCPAYYGDVVGAVTGKPISESVMAYMCVRDALWLLFCCWGSFSVTVVKYADCNCQWDNCMFFCCLSQKADQSKLELNSLPSPISQEKSAETWCVTLRRQTGVIQ